MAERIGKLLDRLIGWVDAVSRVGVWIGGALLILSAGMIFVEVVLRSAFSLSTKGSDELSSYAFAVSTSWALTWGLLRKAHVRVDVLYGLFSSRIRALLDVFGLGLLTIFAFLVTRQVFLLVQQSFNRGAKANTPLSTPLWIPQGLWLMGFMLFAFACALLLARIVWALAAERDTLTVARLTGGQSAEIELEDARTIMESAVSATEPSLDGFHPLDVAPEED